MNVIDQTAIVTGGASGLGAATARALAAAGARVAVFDMDLDGAEKVAGDIGGIAVSCNVSDEAGGEAAFERVRSELGPLRVLVNCAGVGTPARMVNRDGPQPLDKFRQVIEVNLIGTFNMMRLAAADMQGQDALEGGERGVIINTSSVAAFDGQVGQAAYASSKGAVAAMTLPAARELARFGIRVMTIAPGLFGTPMMFALPEDVQQSLGASVPFPSRLGKPEEYADLAMAMIANPMLNGEVVRLDGALRMGPS